jgi:NitT/TauT family transport system ATP-binding protein
LSAVSLKNVSKSFHSLSGEVVSAVTDVSLEIGTGEFLTIVGTSGCGKSTLLQLISGIEKPTSGSIDFQGSDCRPRLGFVFQSNTVFPWRSVRENLSYALEVEGVDRNTRDNEAKRLCQLIGLAPDQFLEKYPKELSGGETRRVAIGMSLAYKANILLLDEPTSQLDYVTRLSMQTIVQDIWMKNPFTAIYVTHDIEEAVFLGDRVLLLERGAIKGTVTIDLKRPRDKKILDDSAFLDYRDWILARLER